MYLGLALGFRGSLTLWPRSPHTLCPQVMGFLAPSAYPIGMRLCFLCRFHRFAVAEFGAIRLHRVLAKGGIEGGGVCGKPGYEGNVNCVTNFAWELL